MNKRSFSVNKIKIAVLTESLSSHSGSRAPIELAKNLKATGNQVKIYAYRENSDNLLKKSLEDLGIEVITFKKNKSRFLSKFLPSLTLIKKLKNDQHTLILLAGFLPLAISAKLSHLPIVKIFMGSQFDAYLENKNPDEKKNTIDLFLNLIVNLLIFIFDLTSIWLASYTIAISYSAAGQLKKRFFKKADAIIYLGGNHFKNKKSNLKNKSFNFLTVSRFTPYKGFHILLKAFSKIDNKNASLTIVGNSKKDKYLKYLKRQKTENVKIIVNPSDSELEKLFAACNCYLSADRLLFFGLPLVEAAFFKKPAIALGYMAANEVIVNNQTGYIVKKSTDLTRKMKTLSSQPDLAKKLGKNAYKKAVLDFSWAKIAKDYQLFFKKIK